MSDIDEITITFSRDEAVLVLNALEILEPDADEREDQRILLEARVRQILINHCAAWLRSEQSDSLNDEQFAKVTDDWQSAIALGINGGLLTADRRIEMRLVHRAATGTRVFEFCRRLTDERPQ